jgi:hypothetical protein
MTTLNLYELCCIVRSMIPHYLNLGLKVIDKVGHYQRDAAV